MMEPSDGGSFSTCRGLSVILLIIMYFGVSLAAESELICSHQPIVALVGGDVILPCHLEPPISASSETVVWTKPALDPKYIHVHKDGRLMFELQNPSYFYRTRLFMDELMKGNVSMKIFKVKLSDAGKYQCFLQSAVKEASIQLTVGAVSTPVIQVVSNNSAEVVLQCECAGWYPEPEVLWLDAEGNLLSAGPTETVRGPDDLYTVSSRLTVEKRHSNNFTCRVQQKDIHQTRETQIHVAADVFIDKYSSPWFWGSILGVAALLYLFILRKIYIKRKQETVEKVTNMVERNNIKSNSPQLIILTEQEEEQENQGSTGEGRERADQQEKEKRKTELTNKLRKTEEPPKTNVTSKALQTGRDEEQQLRREEEEEEDREKKEGEEQEHEEMETTTALIHSVKKMTHTQLNLSFIYRKDFKQTPILHNSFTPF